MLLAVNFHYIRNSFDAPFPSIFGCTPEGFRNALEKMSKEGTFVSCSDIVGAIDGNQSLPNNALIITFDDGLKEQYELALPVLDAMGIPALFFVNTASVEGSVVQNVHKIHLVRSQLSPETVSIALHLQYKELFNSYDEKEIASKASDHYKYDTLEAAILKYKMNFLLTGDQLEVVINQLFEEYFGDEAAIHQSLYMNHQQVIDLGRRGYLGSHGHTHVPTGNMDENRKHEEVERSQSILTQLIGMPVSGFSFPYGSKSSAQGMASILERAGYKFAFTMERAINTHLNQPFALARIDNNDAPGGKHFKAKEESFMTAMSHRSWHLHATSQA